MLLDKLTPEEIEKYQEELLEKVPTDEFKGNVTLRAELNWKDDDLYWAIRNQLVNLGQIYLGGGKGGSVRKIKEEEKDEVPPAVLGKDDTEKKDECINYTCENDLYVPIAKTLREQWAKSQGFDAYRVEITGNQGGKKTGGKWTRPDITIVGYKTYPFIPGRFFEVISFEVKPTSEVNVSSLYEALGHRRLVTKAYLIVHVPAVDRNDLGETINSIAEESEKYGIGLIVVEDPVNIDGWEELLVGKNHDPVPSKLNEFIARQLSEETQSAIIRWFK